MPHSKFHLSGKYGKDPLLIHSWQIWQMCIVIHLLQIWPFLVQYMQMQGSGCVHCRDFRDNAEIEMPMPLDEYVSVAKVPDICRLQRWIWWHDILCAICGGLPEVAAWLRGRMDGATMLSCGMVQYRVVWCGVVWSGVVSYVIVWCGGRMDGATQTSHYGGGGLQHHCRVGTRQGGGCTTHGNKAW